MNRQDGLNRSEQGAALLVAMLASVFLTILGLVLLQILKGGMAQAASTESSVQAEALAQRGLDDTVALIRDAVGDANANAADTSYDSKIQAVEAALDRFLPALVGGKTVNGLKGSYKIELARDNGNFQDYDDNKTLYRYPYSRVLTIRSTGTVEAYTSQSATKQARIYVSTINPVFKYPLSAVGDVTLYGSSYVVGDVLSRSGNLYEYDKALFRGLPGSLYRVQSVDPTIKGFYKAQDAVRLRPDAGAAVQEGNAKFSLFDPFLDPFMPDDVPLSVAGEYVGRKLVDLEGGKNDAGDDVAGALNAGGYLVIGALNGSFDGNFEQSDIESAKRYEDQWVEFRNAFGIKDDFAVRDGVLTMADDPSTKVVLEHGSLYVRYVDDYIAAANLAGSLTIEDPGEAVVVKGDVVIMDGFHLKGNMYIDGSLKIIGSVVLEGSIFVTKDVEMKELKSINGGANEADKPPLILATGGKLVFSDSRADADSVTRIKAFLYSEKEVELYGIQTKLRISGGVHGSRVTLNSVREGAAKSPVAFDTLYPPEPGSGEEKSFEFTSQDGQRAAGPEKSNLQAFFDPLLFDEPPAGIPVTNSVNLFVQRN